MASAGDSVSEVQEILRKRTRAGDALILMSSGDFGGLPEKLFDEL